MNESLRQKAQEILEAIQSSKKILLHLHPRPDGDSVGSALAMQHALRDLGKDAVIIKGDSPLPAYLSHLPSFENIVEKNFFEINPAEFDLFIVQDASSLGMVSGLGQVVFPSNLKVVRIDHHQTKMSNVDIELVETESPATCELLFDLFKEWNIEITHDIALCLFVGIYTDTGGFKYPSVRVNTFLAAAELVSKAPEFSLEISRLEETNTLGNIQYEGLALRSIKQYFGGKVLVSAISFETLRAHNIPKKDTVLGGVIHIPSQLRSVIGCEIGISLVEEEPGIIKASSRRRTGSDIDLSKLAEIFGGGGHKAAAGFTMKTSLREAEKAVVEKIGSLFYGSEKI